MENGWKRIKVGASTILQAGDDGSLDQGLAAEVVTSGQILGIFCG